MFNYMILYYIMHHSVTLSYHEGEGWDAQLELFQLMTIKHRSTLFMPKPKAEDHRWSRNPRPQPQKCSKLVFLNRIKLIFHLSQLVICGSSWCRGFRFHRLEEINRLFVSKAFAIC